MVIAKLVQRWKFSPRANRERLGLDPVRFRRPLVESDQVLVSRTHVWLRVIPSSCKPKQLCRHFPRVANLIAASWADAVLTDRILVDLLADNRGNRAGFPGRVQAELQALRRLHARRIGSRKISAVRNWLQGKQLVI